MKQSKDGQVIVLEEGEHMIIDPRIPPENIGHPVHTWRTKAFELYRLSERRRGIIRRLLRQRTAERKANAPTDWQGFW